MDNGSLDRRRRDLAESFKRIENPFDTDKVLRARDSIVDVSEIHQREFDKLTAELNVVRRSGRSRGILVTGVAGSGKSHLIARLYNSRSRDVLFFQVQALPGGRAWLKHILRCMVGDLEQPIGPEAPDTPQLVTLVKHFIDGVRHELGRTDESGYSLLTLNKALDARQRQIRKAISDPSVKDVLTVLTNLWKWGAPLARSRNDEKLRRKKDLAIQWLKASMIDESDLAQIGARVNLGADEDEGQSAYLNALRVFGHLTVGRAPIILYFDQLDTMENETISSLGDQLLHLIGSDAAAPNYLVVTAGVREEISKFLNEGIVKRAVADVIFRTELDLPALTMDQCLKVVESRLQDLFSSNDGQVFPDGADSLFPFTRDSLELQLQGPIRPSPRRVLKIARSIFDEITAEISPRWLQEWPNVPVLVIDQPAKPPPPAGSINDFLSEELKNKIFDRRTMKLAGPVDCDLLGEAIHRLIKEAGESFKVRLADVPKGAYRKPNESFFCLRLPETGLGITGIVINNKNHGGSMKACLNRSLEYLGHFGDGYTIVFARDAASKSIDQWPACVEPLAALRRTGRFRRVSIGGEEIAGILALDDLRREVPDLIVPGSDSHDRHQVTGEDFSRFLRETDILLKLPLIAGLMNRLEKGKPSGPTGMPKPMAKIATTRDKDPAPLTNRSPQNAENFVRARVEARCTIEFREVVTEWANHNQRVHPLPGDEQAIDNAVRSLTGKGLVLSVGAGAKRILKKVAQGS